MLNKNTLSSFEKFYQKNRIKCPDVHIVLGSGLAGAIENLSLEKQWSLLGTLKFSDIAGFSSASAPGHKGAYQFYKNSKRNKTICLQTGRLHGYEGLPPREVVKTVTYPYIMGTKKFLLTNAAGSLTTKYSVGSVMFIEDHVNLTGTNPLWGENQKDFHQRPLGPRFPDMSGVYNSKITKKFQTHFKQKKIETHLGTYLGVSGPGYETPAEIKMFAKLGLKAVGMSTVWEAMQLQYLGATTIGFSMISNWGAGLNPKEKLTHEDVLSSSKTSAKKILETLFESFELNLFDHK